MKKIAVIAARMATFNPGMATVDLAFDAILRRHRLLDKFEVKRYYLFESPISSFVANGATVSYQPMIGHLEDVYANDIIIFWGDFHHAWNYQQRDVRGHYRQAYGPAAQFLSNEQIQDYLLFRSATEDILRKVISFGTTFMGDNESSLDISEDYLIVLKRFLSHVKYIKVRDQFSSMRVSHLLNNYADNYLGTDCALLLNYDDIEKLAASATDNSEPRGYISAFFGRSPQSLLPELIRFTNLIAARLEKKVIWLPWLRQLSDSNYRNILIRSWFSEHIGLNSPIRILRKHDVQPKNYAMVMRLLLDSSLVVTDTYHLSLIAWKLGIPAICIGFGSKSSQHTLGDKKKEVFYSSYGAQPYYIFTEDLLNKTTKWSVIEKLDMLLKQATPLASTVHQNICNHTKAVEKSLVDAISLILNDHFSR